MSIVCTEHTASNLRVGILVIPGALLLAAFGHLFFGGFALWVALLVDVMAAAICVMGAIQVMGYLNKKIELDDAGVTYTDSLGRSFTYPWSRVVAYDLRETANSIEFALADPTSTPEHESGIRRTFHKECAGFEQMVDYLSMRGMPVSVK